MSLLLSSIVPVLEGAVTFFLEYMVFADDGLGVFTVAVLNVFFVHSSVDVFWHVAAVWKCRPIQL